MSPKGKIFTQEKAIELSKLENIAILCGHYEGVDQRIIDKIVDEEISAGDYVLTGGELPAMIVTDAVARMCEGVLSDNVCFMEESIYSGLLEYPHYTRPEIWDGERVPEILLSGHHENIQKWRREKSLEITAVRRPEMCEKYILQHPEKLIKNKK
jgi:tRNA (guanine37-N1)-methyltransferase